MDNDKELITVTPISWYFDEEMPLDRFIAHLQAIYNEVPDGFKGSAIARFERGSYDSGDSFHVSYQRYETDEERDNRIARHRQYEVESESRERAHYERLKRKYERP